VSAGQLARSRRVADRPTITRDGRVADRGDRVKHVLNSARGVDVEAVKNRLGCQRTPSRQASDAADCTDCPSMMIERAPVAKTSARFASSAGNRE
jgi:hypothetical protein